MQKIGFFAMLQGIYGAINAFALALQGFGNAAKNLSEWADEATGTFVDEARIERQIKIQDLKRKQLSGAPLEVEAKEVTA